MQAPWKHASQHSCTESRKLVSVQRPVQTKEEQDSPAPKDWISEQGRWEPAHTVSHELRKELQSDGNGAPSFGAGQGRGARFSVQVAEGPVRGTDQRSEGR